MQAYPSTRLVPAPVCRTAHRPHRALRTWKVEAGAGAPALRTRRPKAPPHLAGRRATRDDPPHVLLEQRLDRVDVGIHVPLQGPAHARLPAGLGDVELDLTTRPRRHARTHTPTRTQGRRRTMVSALRADRCSRRGGHNARTTSGQGHTSELSDVASAIMVTPFKPFSRRCVHSARSLLIVYGVLSAAWSRKRPGASGTRADLSRRAPTLRNAVNHPSPRTSRSPTRTAPATRQCVCARAPASAVSPAHVVAASGGAAVVVAAFVVVAVISSASTVDARPRRHRRRSAVPPCRLGCSGRGRQLQVLHAVGGGRRAQGVRPCPGDQGKRDGTGAVGRRCAAQFVQTDDPGPFRPPYALRHREPMARTDREDEAHVGDLRQRDPPR